MVYKIRTKNVVYQKKKNQKLLILHPLHPSLCTLLISKILHHPANMGSYEICTLIYFFQKKKKTTSFLLFCMYTLWGEFLHTGIFEKPPKLKILWTHDQTYKTLLFNFDLSLSLQSLSPTTHKIQLPICKNHKINQ